MNKDPEQSRSGFEQWISHDPYARDITRLGPDSGWPGQYKDYITQLAWEAWQQGRSSEPQD